MTEQELELIKGFIANEKMSNAVKKHLLEEIAPDGWVGAVDRDLPPQEYKSRIQAILEGKELVTKKFNDMKLMNIETGQERKKIRI